MRPIPDELCHGVFDRRAAHAHGVTDRMLEGGRFVRVLPRAWRHRDHVMSDDDWVAAARIALPADAHLTGITRIQRLGLDVGPRLPVRFVVARDHHLAHDEVFLHRTVRLPPTDEVGVVPAAAYLAFCARARAIDAIAVGDWLLHRSHTTTEEIRELALSAPWRAGASEAIWVLDHLDGCARSLPESETRAVLEFAGLPLLETNPEVVIGPGVTITPDLWSELWRTAVEYEGGQHQTDRDQYVTDIDRYAAMRRADIAYVQVTREKLRHARTLVGEVHRILVEQGYDGPAPVFGEQWERLFLPLTTIVGPRVLRHRLER